MWVSISMMNIFASLRMYAGKWNVKEERPFSAEEIAAVESAVVVPSQYGSSVCFTMVGGGQKYIPLSTDATLNVGDSVDITKATLVTLAKSGEEDIYRVSI